MSDSTISIQNYSKSFGSHQVIKDLSFEVKKGEIFAFIGANGSGKTTTIRSLLGIYQADSGELLVNGKIYSPAEANILGYLPEERGLYTNSRVLEMMIYFGEIKGMSAQDARREATDYLEKVELGDKAYEQVKKLSSGQQQKIQIGITIINKPELLILDEPTKGFDPVNRQLLMDILKELNDEGSTIMFSSHQMDETERIADRLAMLKDGKRRLYGELEEVKREFGSDTILITYSGKFPDNKELFTATADTNFAEVTPNKEKTPEEILKFLVSKGLKISKFDIGTPSLHQVFVKVSREKDK